MSISAASSLALWGSAHSAGTSADEVLASLSELGMTAGVRRDGPSLAGSVAASLPGPGEPAAGPAVLLPLMRAAKPALVLPRAGDVRGLPVPSGPTTGAALKAGAAVVYLDIGVTVVPVDGHWRVFDAVGLPAHHDSVSARQELDEAVAKATEIFVKADLGVQAATARREVAEHVLRHSISWPPGTPARAAAMLHRCLHLDALLTVLDQHRTAAVNGHQLDQVKAVIVSLTRAAADARAAATEYAVQTLFRGQLDRPHTDDHSGLVPHRWS